MCTDPSDNLHHKIEILTLKSPMSHFRAEHIPAADDARQGRSTSEGLEPVTDAGDHAETAPIALPSDRGLHVVIHSSDRDAPQVREVSSPKYSVPEQSLISAVTNDHPTKPKTESTEAWKYVPFICGLRMRRRTFWILVILLIIIVLGAAIGGGIGGSLANSNQDQNPTPTAVNNPTTVTITPSSTPITHGQHLFHSISHQLSVHANGI